MYKIRVFGRASGKVVKEIVLSEKHLEKDLLEILQDSGIPVASSCNSEGVCKKCVFNEDLLSCQLTLREFLQTGENTLNFDYL